MELLRCGLSTVIYSDHKRIKTNQRELLCQDLKQYVVKNIYA